MFHLSASKGVRRTDLGRDSEPTSRSNSQSPILDGHDFQLNHPFEYDFIDQSQPAESTSTKSLQIRQNEDDDQTFSFRLFASSAKDKETIATGASESGYGQRITLQASPSPSSVPLSAGRFLRPDRPESCYFTSSLSDGELRELSKQYASIAVSSEEILSVSKQIQWPGTALPWRVIHIFSPATTSKNRTTTPSRPVELNEASKKSKPNKKRRIHLRKLLAARTASANAILRTKETAEEKEKGLRQKKSAKNRKNQLRRREKERQKKAQAKASTGDDGKARNGGDVDGGDG